MLFINPQWQGSGLTDELRFGAETLSSYYGNSQKTIIPLSKKALTTIDNIKCYEPILEQLTRFRQILADSNARKVSTVGGDCGIEVIPISYLNKIYGENIGVIWIDAHADLNTPDSSPSKTFHGMPLRMLLGEGNKNFVDLLFSRLKPEQICYVGLRDLDEPESEYIQRHHMATVDYCQYAAVEPKIKNFDKVYIHLDLDVLDRSEFEFSMFPTDNGSLVSDVAALVEKIIARHNVVGFCVTECTATKLEQLERIKPILDRVEL